tara:strand:+ start:2184 stop:2999 length:816 start_codon:yes stop_codon:yes gene_type:complete
MSIKKIDKYVKEIERNGFVIIKDLISKNECDKFKSLLEMYHKKYHKKYAFNKKNKSSLADKTLEKVVFNLHNKDLIWFKLFQNKIIISILDIVLKKGSFKNSEPYYLNNISARTPLKGNKGQQIHVDSNLPGVNYNIVTNVQWLLDDFNKENGSTYLVSKTHKVQKYAYGKNIKNKILIKANQGSVLVYNANLWHGGSEKKNNKTRWALILGYARWFIKPSFDYMLNTPLKIYKKLNKKQKSLLGFNLIPPRDEFTRTTRRSSFFEKPKSY